MSKLSLTIKHWFELAFNTIILNKSRMPWVDYLRGIAIVLVVYRHVLIGIDRTGMKVPYVLEQANMIFFSFRMPLFFILSGLFIAGSIGKRSVGSLIEIKFENLLYPYLIWAFLQTGLQFVLSDYTNAGRTWKDFLFILYQPRALDQFWYLPALFNTTVIYILLKTKLKLPTWLQLILGMGFYFLSPHVEQVSMISDWMKFYFFFALGDALSVVFFQTKAQKFLNSWATLLAMIPVFAVTQYYYLSNNISDDDLIPFMIIALIGCVSMFVFAFRLQQWNVLRFLRVLGFHSIYIYVMHVIISAFSRVALTKLFGIYDPTTLLFVGIALGVIIPVILYNLIIKRWLPFLFTYKPAREK